MNRAITDPITVEILMMKTPWKNIRWWLLSIQIIFFKPEPEFCKEFSQCPQPWSRLCLCLSHLSYSYFSRLMAVISGCGNIITNLAVLCPDHTFWRPPAPPSHCSRTQTTAVFTQLMTSAADTEAPHMINVSLHHLLPPTAQPHQCQLTAVSTTTNLNEAVRQPQTQLSWLPPRPIDTLVLQ